MKPLFSMPKPMPKPTGQPMTKETLSAIIESVELDPLAGHGSMTKREILIDRLLAHCRMVQPETTVKAPELLLSELELRTKDIVT